VKRLIVNRTFWELADPRIERVRVIDEPVRQTPCRSPKDTKQRPGNKTGIKCKTQYQLSRFAYDAASIHFYAFRYLEGGIR
jgi:hypothetical protein